MSRTAQNVIPAAIPAAALIIAMTVVTGASGESAARIQVTPPQTEVYVDGHHVGIVDNFDGFSQRLRVTPGEHLIELYLDGHRPVRQTVRFIAGETYRIRHEMEPLPPGEAAPSRPTPRAEASAPAATSFDALGRSIAGDAAALPAAGSGTIGIRVQPADAVVLIDGERWQASGDRLDIQVTAGPHRIDVQKAGYQPFSTSVQVRAGETSGLNVSLTKSGGI